MFEDIQKLALQASGANAVALGGMGFPGLPMMPGMGSMSPLETPTKVVALTQVSYLLKWCFELLSGQLSVSEDSSMSGLITLFQAF